MKIFKLAAASLAALSLVAVSAANNASAFQFSYTSGFQVQNLSGSVANIVVTFYDAAGNVSGSGISDTIPANGSKNYYPLSQVASGFNGSAVVSSDQQVAAVVNVIGGNFAAAAAYVGFQQGATTQLIPLLMKNNSGFSTWFKLQNTGSATANATVTYSDGTSASAAIAPGASATFDQSTEAHNAAVFAANITSNQPVAATIIQEDSKTLFAYNSFPAGVSNPVMPLVNANNSGYVTGIQVQNGGAASTNVTLSYTPSSAGTACTETQTIAPGQSATFALNAFASTVAGENCADGATFIGSAAVTANSGSQPLVAVVNQLLLGVNGEAYGAFDPAAATGTVVMPLIMDRNSGYYTGFNVVNVGAAATTVNCTFTGSAVTVGGSLAAGQGLTAIQNNQIANGYVGSGTCTAASGGKVVAVVNELGSGAGDQLLVYEGITQ